jgi:hypothetical protein
MHLASNMTVTNPTMLTREERLQNALRFAVIRDSIHAWKNADAQLGPITVEMVNDLALPALCAIHGSLDVLGELKRIGADLLCAGQDGRTPIRMAADNGDMEMIEFLEAAGARVHSRVTYPVGALKKNGAPRHLKLVVSGVQSSLPV